MAISRAACFSICLVVLLLLLLVPDVLLVRDGVVVGARLISCVVVVGARISPLAHYTVVKLARVGHH